jgi:fimbrial chaperone protein
LSRIKLFVRPNNLAMPPEEALSQRFERTGDHLKVSNASPYYVTLVNLQLAVKLDNLMIALKTRRSRCSRRLRAARFPGRA